MLSLPHQSSNAPSEEDYQRWLTTRDSLGEDQRSRIKAKYALLQHKPLISLVISPNESMLQPGYLADSIRSISNQIYEEWELIIPASAGLSSGMQQLALASFLADSRVKTVAVSETTSFNATTNSALLKCSGDFVGFVFPGDQLSDDALYQVVIRIAADYPDLAFTDEDSINSAGYRSRPKFKPGWDRDLLLSGDYIGGLTLFRRELIQELGFLRQDTDDLAYWDLLLRAAVVTTDDRVRHIPIVCYHRREREEQLLHCSAARTFPKPDDITTATRILREHFESCGEPAAGFSLVGSGPSYIRVERSVPDPPPMVSVIMPTRDQMKFLQCCTEGILSQTNYAPLELLIIDNDSQQPDALDFLSQIAKDSRVRVLRYPGKFNYSAMNNAAAREANGEVLLFLNNDIQIISPDWLRELVSQIVRPEVGAVGAKLLYPDWRIQHAGVLLGPSDTGWVVTHFGRFAQRFDDGYQGQLAVPRSPSAVTGACLGIRHELYDLVGGFDEVHFPVAFNDIDLCLRLGDWGYKILWTPYAELIHHECVSRKGDQSDNLPVSYSENHEHEYFRAKWGKLVEGGDPFNNPNLLFDWREGSRASRE